MRHPVSKRYAQAFIELGVLRGNYRALQRQLRVFADLYTASSDLQAVLRNPSVRIEERRNIMRAIGRRAMWDPMTVNLALLLLDNGRVQFVADIADEFDTRVDEQDGNVRAHVTTAKTLPMAQVAGIKNAIRKMTGKNVLLESVVDPTLLGGAVTRIGGTVYDGSLRTQLDNLRGTILEEV